MKITTTVVQTAVQQITHPKTQLPYALVRNSRGSLPVYSDIRNAGTRYQVQIRNVLGDANALLSHLRASLFPHDSAEAVQLQGRVIRDRHIVLQGRGTHWKNKVTDWLESRGF